MCGFKVADWPLLPSSKFYISYRKTLKYVYLFKILHQQISCWGTLICHGPHCHSQITWLVPPFRKFVDPPLIRRCLCVTEGKVSPILANGTFCSLPVLRCRSDGRVQHATVHTSRVQSHWRQGQSLTTLCNSWSVIKFELIANLLRNRKE